LRRNDEGQDLVEYALLVGLIFVAALTTVNGVATVIKTQFWDVVANLL
jgi:Flp pilus assembly pilin Flp